MGDFFHGWRRKTGCVTLVMACLVTAGWARSFLVTDELTVPGRLFPSCKSKILLYSSIRGIEIERQWSDNEGADFANANGALNAYPVTSNDYRKGRSPFDSWGLTIDETSSLCGFVVEVGHLKHNGKVLAWVAPYWSLVLPPTLLSAYLILWKPRKRAEP